jgi:hypothetical protein
MFPQRSQYFSSMLRICDISELTPIILLPLWKKNPCRRREAKIAGVGLRKNFASVPATGLVSFAMTCLLFVLKATQPWVRSP